MNVATTRPSQDARGRFVAWLLATVLTAAAVAAPGAAAWAADPEPTPAAPTPTFPAGTVAKVAGMDLTRADLAEYAKAAKDTQFSDSDIASASNAKLGPLVEQVAVSLFIAKQYLGLKKTVENTPVDASILRTARLQEQAELSQRYSQQQVLSNVPEPTEADVAAFYKENVEHFVQPLVFSMRQIFVSTYEKVLTKEGETLEDLAKRITGDEKAVGLILVDNDAKSPRAPGWTPDSPGATKPLEAGEHLLVPMSPEKRKEREALILEARKRLEKGDDFVAVAKKYSDAGAGELIEDLPMTGRPVLPAFIDAAKATDPGHLSKVFETKHGYNLIRVESKTENEPLPQEKVAPQILSILRSDAKDRVLEKATDDMLAQPGVVIHYADLKNMTKSSDPVVMSVDDTSVTLSELGSSSLATVTADTPDADILRVLRAHPVIRETLFARAARKMGLDREKDVQLALASKAYRSLSKAFEESLQKRNAAQAVSDDEEKKYFEANARQFSSPQTCSFYILAVSVGGTTGTAIIPPEADKAMTRLTQLVAGVKTADDFKKVALENTTSEQMKRNGCLIEKAPMPDLPTPLAQALAGTEVGAMTGPVYVKPAVLIAWVLERNEARTATFDEAKDDIANAIRNKRLSETYLQVRKEMVEQTGLTMQ